MDKADRTELIKAIGAAEAVGCSFGEPDLKRLPKGYETDEDWEHLLRRKAFVLRTLTNQPLPNWLSKPDAVDEFMKLASAFQPLLKWLGKS